MTNDVGNSYIFDHKLQWTSSECLTNVTITLKVAMVTYIGCIQKLLWLHTYGYIYVGKTVN